MLRDEQLLNNVLNTINGPIMSTIFFMGIFLNAVTIFILIRTKIPPKKDSYAVTFPNKRKLSRTLTNTTLRKDSSVSNTVIEEERKLTLPVDKTVLYRHEEIWHKTILLKKGPRRPRIYIYLLWMSSSDIAILGCAFMNFSIPTLFDYYALGGYMLTVPIWYTLSNASVVASVWFMLILVKDRYQALCSSLFRIASKESTSYRDIHAKLGILSIFSIVFATPRFFEIYILYDESEKLYFMVLTPLIESTVYQLGYRIFCSLVFYSIVPYVIVFVMLTKICIVLRKASRKRAEMHVSTKQQRMINSESDVLIIVLAVRFLVSRLLLILLDMIECLVGADAYQNSPFTMLGNSVSNLLVVFTSATTFFVYVVVSEKFRSEVFRILRMSKRNLVM